MIKFSGQTTRLARVSRSSDGSDSFVTVISPNATFSQSEGLPKIDLTDLYFIRDIVPSLTVLDITISSVFYMQQTITKIANKTRVIWLLITSCFGTGIWRDNYKWINTEQWKN